MKLIIKHTQDLVCLLIAMMFSFTAQAIVPTPAGPQTHPIAITGVTIHTGNGDVIDNGVISFTNGQIIHVAESDAATVISLKESNHEIIEMKGKHLYPGFVLPNTAVGLSEVNSVRATLDYREQGEINPNVRTIVAYNTDSELIPTMRFNGILTAQITPLGPLIAGFSSIVKFDGWNWEDAAYEIDDGMHLYWPVMNRRNYDIMGGTISIEKNKKYDGLVDSLNGLFDNASVYQANSDLNLKLAAIRKLINGQTRLYIHANGPKEIISAVRFAIRQKVKNIILVGGQGALSVKDFLVENNIPVIVSGVHGLPISEDADIDQTFRRPAELIAAGLKVGLTTGTREPSGSRNFPFMAGSAVAYGVGKEAAITMITRTNAEILGIADRVGTLEVGKDATMFISEGDALDMRGNRILKAFIQGRDIDLSGTQQQLFERYKKKYSEND